jgi:hypothetical protein
MAIGKESVPVMIAELKIAAEAVLFSSIKAEEESKDVLSGFAAELPIRRCLRSNLCHFVDCWRV